MAHRSKSELNVLYQQLKSNTFIDLEHSIAKIHQEVFEKTDCLDCANCCKSAPPIVTNADIKRIAKALNTSPKQVKRQYILVDFNGEMSFDRVPCVFLGKDNYCSIYESRPNACRAYPHTDGKDFMRSRAVHFKNQEICPAVESILDGLESSLSDLKK